jgi:uncharacterized protein YegL
MDNKFKTYVAFILDQSGSMQGTKSQTIQSFNEYVQQTKHNSETQDIYCSLITFCGHVIEHAWCQPAHSIQELNEETYKPNGSTAMRDAIGYTIKKLTDSTDQKDEDAAFLVIIISDGEENASNNYSKETLKQMISSLQETNKWTFTYMGCSEDYLEEVAKETNIPITNMASWNNSTDNATKFGMQKGLEKVGTYYKAREKGDTILSNFYSDTNKCAKFELEIEEVIPKVLNLGVKNT